ncbi:MAG: TraB/GumN family protein [Flavihumibacter sp.]
MRLIRYCLYLLFGFASQVPAQQTAPANSLLWEISGKGLSRPAYLFGTIHLICAADVKLSDSLLYCIRQAQQVYMEINPKDRPVVLFGTHRSTRMKNDERLENLVTAEEYERVRTFLRKNKTLLNLRVMSKIKPYGADGDHQPPAHTL